MLRRVAMLRVVAAVLSTTVLYCCLAPTRGAEPKRAAAPRYNAFDDFDPEDYPSEDAVKRLLIPVGSRPGRIADRRSHRMFICQIAGLFRLDLTWEQGSALRFSLLAPDEHRELSLHLWNGQQGVTLTYYPRYYNTWAAYATTRAPGEPEPAQFALWATDGGRYRRCGIGTLELHYHQGNLVLTRGDVRLLSVPFEGPPGEVYLEGAGLVRGLEMVRQAVPPPAPASRPTVFASAKPAELPWAMEPVEGCGLNKWPDGRVELFASDKSGAVQAGTRAVKPGLYEFVFLVEDPEPGTGIYLGNAEGKQLCRLAFFRHNRSKQTLFGPLAPSSIETQKAFDGRMRPAPFAGRRQWFRLTVGAGVVKYWTSGDGVHWSQDGPGAETLEGACTHVGLYCCPAPKARAIKLDRVEVRRFEALSLLAPQEVQDRVDAAALVKADSIQAWERLVSQSRPADVSADTWWRACALRTLCENPRLALGQALLDRLLEAAQGEAENLQWQLQLIGEAALLSHPAGEFRAAERLGQRLERLGLMLARNGYSGPFTAVSRAMMRLPLWTEQPPSPFLDRLLMYELFAKLGQDRLEEVQELCRQVRYWNRTGRRDAASPLWTARARHLVYWAEAQATGRPPKEAGPMPVGPSPWRHPLTVHSTKEGYNVFGEFAAALDGQTYREACQIISSAAQTEGLGLLPDRKDRRLWVSLPVAIELAMRDHPPLRQAMEEGFGALGELRVKKAAAQGDTAAMAAVTLQFYGTNAAREAHLWLGDRMLAAGRFTEALTHYEEALAANPHATSPALLARQRLASALLGGQGGQAPTEPVQLGSTRLSPQQFERLVDQIRQTRRAAISAAPALESDPTPQNEGCFRPDFYQTRLWATIESPPLRKPGVLPDRGIDWAGRQTAVAVAGNQMFVSNQVDQFAFDLETGRQDWVQRGPAVDPQWPLIPMRPLVAGGRVFVRRLAEVTPELACFGAADGRLYWSCKPDSYVASDPLSFGGDLLALTISEDTGQKLILSLVNLDVQSGRLRSRTVLAEFYDLWRRRLPFQATVAGNTIVAVGGGSVLCCDALGNVHWVRRQIWAPPPEGDYAQAQPWFEQCYGPPLIDAGRLYAAQPGTWCLECIDRKTGRLRWRESVLGLTRIVGLAHGRLIVETSDGLLALDADLGKIHWHHAADGLQHARIAGPEQTVFYVQLTRVEGAGPQLTLVWVDADSGQLRQKAPWDVPADAEPLCGPLVGCGGRQWGLFGSAGNPTRRAVFELFPAGGQMAGAKRSVPQPGP